MEITDLASPVGRIRVTFLGSSPGNPAASYAGSLLVDVPAYGFTFASGLLDPPQDDPTWRAKASDIARFVTDAATLAGTPARILALEDAWYDGETQEEKDRLSRTTKKAYNDMPGSGFPPYFGFSPSTRAGCGRTGGLSFTRLRLPSAFVFTQVRTSGNFTVYSTKRCLCTAPRAGHPGVEARRLLLHGPTGPPTGQGSCGRPCVKWGYGPPLAGWRHWCSIETSANTNRTPC